jgi:hypothetical protein
MYDLPIQPTQNKTSGYPRHYYIQDNSAQDNLIDKCIASFLAKKQLIGYSNSPFLHSALDPVNYNQTGRFPVGTNLGLHLHLPISRERNLLVAGAVLADELVNVLDVKGLSLLGGVVLDTLPSAVELLLL